MSTLESIIQEPPSGFEVMPKIRCTDGFTVSAQGSMGHYCADANGTRPGFDLKATPPMRSLEVGYPSERPEPWGEWEQYAETPTDPTSTVYGWVPVELIRALIASHGGEA